MSGRRAVLVGGPYNGAMTPPIPDTWPWPPAHCVSVRDGGWQHHVHDGDGRYRWVGACAEVGHDGPAPVEMERCCCGHEG